MLFESAASDGVSLVASLAEYMGSKMEKGLLKLPENFGKGFIKYFDLGLLLKMSILQYELKEDMTIKRAGASTGNNEITFSFRNVFREHSEVKKSILHAGKNAALLPSVQVSSSDIELEIFTPANTKINTILITVHADLLKDLLNKKEGNTLLQNIVSGNQSYLYDEIISPGIQDVATRIAGANVPEQLEGFYYKLKAQELIYLFFVELLKRHNTAGYPLNTSDVKTMYLIRDKIISDLSVPPDISSLVLFSNMSESKMNRLFKQIFGNSIYNYYQVLRMNEAAYLIKEQKFSVSEAGYRLGFSNLSHFTRMFERHIGLKPKKYSATVGF